ncbi:FACT complex subunit spt16, partial [Cryomyces antarcticus]
EWKKAYGDLSKEVEEVDITTALSAAALAVKDEKELRAMRDASRASSGLMANYFVDQMSGILDEEKKITHKALAQKVEDKISDEKFFQKLKVSNGFDPQQLDWAYQPIVQSGGKYDLRLSAVPDDENLHAGVITSAFGLRYQTYCSSIARTYMVDPNKAQEGNYKLLLSIHEIVLKEIRDGVLAKDVYAKALSFLKSKKPELEKNFLKSVGAGIGIEARDATLVLNAKSTRTLKDGMTLSITTGFNDLTNPKPQDKKSNTYSLVLTDTVRVRVSAGETVVFTKDAPTDLESTSFFFKDEEEEQEKVKPKAKKDSRVGAVAQTNITKTRLRGERSTNQDAEKEAARR